FVGDNKEPDGSMMKYGVQVVARGEGRFNVKFLKGGLPGAGWDGKTELSVAAGTIDGKTTFLQRTASGTITAKELTISDTRGLDGTFKKTERVSPTLGEKPPEGAVVLFGAKGDEKKWHGGKIVKLSDGAFLNKGVTSMQSFGKMKAHVEFRLPWMPNSGGQGRGNSGMYFQNRYEMQVLDSFGLKGENNECGGIYTQYKPLVNMCLPPMVWQTYDFEFTPAQFDGEKKTTAAKLTARHNGILIHDNIEFKGPTGGGQPEKDNPGPFQLQDHGDPVVYRNFWVVELK
ncbi:MAG: 3-keto-disaccharide hydrolase, partial [Gemmataceae bacterium]